MRERLHASGGSAKTVVMKGTNPTYWEDFEVGQRIALGSVSFTEEEIVAFARLYDPQSFHVDPEAAKGSIFGGVIASGWHVTSKLMRIFVESYIDPRTALGSPGLDEVRWLKPVRPGDTLTAYVECTAKIPSKSKPDRGVLHEFWVAENQRGERVVTVKGLNLIRRRPA